MKNKAKNIERKQFIKVNKKIVLMLLIILLSLVVALIVNVVKAGTFDITLTQLSGDNYPQGAVNISWPTYDSRKLLDIGVPVKVKSSLNEDLSKTPETVILGAFAIFFASSAALESKLTLLKSTVSPSNSIGEFVSKFTVVTIAPSGFSASHV